MIIESILVVRKSISDLLAIATSAVEVRFRLGLALKPGVRWQQAGHGSEEVFQEWLGTNQAIDGRIGILCFYLLKGHAY